MFAIFRADIRIIDTVKKAALSQLLLENIVSTQPGEKLDEKLASIALPDTVGECRFSCVAKTALCSLRRHQSVPPPSTDEKAWWDTPGKFFNFFFTIARPTAWAFIDGPGGLVSIEEIQQMNLYRRGNPFESPLDSPLSSPTTSDEELFTSALALQTPLTPVPVSTRRPPPPPPRAANE